MTSTGWGSGLDGGALEHAADSPVLTKGTLCMLYTHTHAHTGMVKCHSWGPCQSASGINQICAFLSSFSGCIYKRTGGWAMLGKRG